MTGTSRRPARAGLLSVTARSKPLRDTGRLRACWRVETGKELNHAVRGVYVLTGPAIRFRPEPATHRRATRARRGASRRTDSRCGASLLLCLLLAVRVAWGVH